MSERDLAALDLTALDLLPPLPTAFLRGEELDLLEPLRFLEPGQEPSGSPPEVDRAGLAESLAEANAVWGHPGADALAVRLADPTTRVVVTGQQPGMLGGPLYALSKAMAAARWAERIEDHGHPAVAVFWVATEDHDFAEVAQAAAIEASGLERWDLGDDPAPLVPVGARPLGSPIDEVISSWRDGQQSESYAAWIERVAAWHRPDTRFGEAFCRTLAGMMGERCPLLLDATAPAVKEAQREGLTRLVVERVRLEERQAARDQEIESRGFPLQVRPQRGVSPLFLLHDGARRRIEWRGEDRFSLRGVDGFEESVDVLESIVRDEPGRVSPGVLARSAIQDLILGTHLQILGPGELSYKAQTAPAFEILDIEGPWVSLRPQALVLTARQRQHAEELGLSLDDLVAGRVEIDAAVASHAGEDFVAPVEERVTAEMASLREPTLALDRSLEKPLEKTGDQVRRALEAFGSKVAAAAARRHEVLRRRVESLTTTVRPAGVLQERIVSGAHFVGRYPGFSEALWRQLDLDPRRLHLIDPDPASPEGRPGGGESE